jgi:hypothetical protein
LFGKNVRLALISLEYISLSFSLILVFVSVEFLKDGEHPVPGSLQAPEHNPACPLEQFVA